jgi:hypothetical protein
MLLGQAYVAKRHAKWWTLLKPCFDEIADVLLKIRVSE